MIFFINFTIFPKIYLLNPSVSDPYRVQNMLVDTCNVYLENVEYTYVHYAGACI